MSGYGVTMLRDQYSSITTPSVTAVPFTSMTQNSDVRPGLARTSHVSRTFLSPMYAIAVRQRTIGPSVHIAVSHSRPITIAKRRSPANPTVLTDLRHIRYVRLAKSRTKRTGVGLWWEATVIRAKNFA